ncbi:SpoIIE family protein phosphatase [Kitasatospora sp. NPDC089509]|uniref:SpoIIE family protein phosphatase n=1 Tax=Kitasatospora sp. NPDC089509 TaxID=3364079 RepID=UPI00380ACB15
MGRTPRRTAPDPVPHTGTTAPEADPSAGADLSGLAFEHATVGLALLDRDGLELAANAAWSALLGDPPEGATPVRWTARLSGRARVSARATVRAARTPERPAATVLRLPPRHGTPGRDRSVLLSVRRIEPDRRDGGNGPAGPSPLWLAQVRELTEADEALDPTLRLALLTAGVAVWAYDLATGEERWFAGSQSLFGLPMDAATGRTGQQVLAAMEPEDRERMLRVSSRISQGSDRLETRYAMRDGRGRLRWMHVDGRVHELGDPPHRWLVGVTREVTEEVRRSGRLRQRLLSETERAAMIEEVATALLGASTVADVASAVTGPFHQAVDAAGAVVLVPEEGRLVPLAASGTGVGSAKVLNGVRVDDPSLPVTRVLEERRAHFASSRAQLRALCRGEPHERVESAPGESWALLPLRCGGDATGALVLAYATRHDFSVEERATLLALAGLTSQALERSALVQDRLALGQAVQKALLPHDLPDLTGVPGLAGLRMACRYQPARDGAGVGGDWYDVFRLPAGGLGVSIGDVEGHGVESAAVMGQVRTALRAYAWTGVGVQRVLTATNELVCSLGGVLFTTCSYAEVDPVAGVLEAASAGHVPGVLGLVDGGTALLAPEPGPPLGVLTGAEYPVAREPLAGLAVLTLLTDGLVEGPDEDLDAGLERVRTIVAEHRSRGPEALAGALIDSSGSTGHLDDATLLVLDWASPRSG